MKAIGKDIADFKPPPDVHWQPLKQHEQREQQGNQFVIRDTITGQTTPQLPEGFQFSKVPTLTSVSDQGGVNRGFLDYILYQVQLLLSVQYDLQHRIWNDLKASLKAAQLFRTFLGYSLFWNLNYAPYPTKAFFQRKKVAAAELATSSTYGPFSAEFQAYLPLICLELQQEEPVTREGILQIFNKIEEMRSLQILGPLVKVMRWFSWWDSYQFYLGENWMTKYVIMSATDKGSFEEEALDTPEGMTPQEEIRHLKGKLGNWVLAPTFVTCQRMWEKDLIAEMGRPLWSASTHLSQHVHTPDEFLQHVVHMATGGWKDELQSLIDHGCFSVPAMKRLYSDNGMGTTTNLQTHKKLLLKLLAMRATSLVGAFLKPPHRYAGLGKSETAQSTSKQMQGEWKAILDIERLVASGQSIKPYESMHFTTTSLCRFHYLANEQDRLLNRQGTATAAATELTKATARRPGNTVIVENTHQFAKDTMREARHNMTSRVHKYHSALSSNVLSGCKIPHIQVTPFAKLQADISKPKVQSIVQATNPNSHSMAKEFQSCMKYKASEPNFAWPSSSHTSLFQEAASLEFLLQKGHGLDTKKIDAATLVCLVGHGDILAYRPGGRLMMVLQASSHNFLAWELQVVPGEDDNQPALFTLYRQAATAVTWQTIQNLDDWLAVPTQAALQHAHGPLVFQQCGTPQQLPEAKIKAGLNLTVKQCRMILEQFNIFLPKQANKKEHYRAVFDLFLDTEEEKEEAMNKSSLNRKQEEEEEDGELDEEYEELLNQLEETHNCGDPDLKQEKAKLKKKKSKKRRAEGI